MEPYFKRVTAKSPTMSMTHFMLSFSLPIYVLLAVVYEERELVTTLGRDYEDYQRRVRMIVPLPK